MTNPPQDPLVGTRLHNYEILEVVSRSDTETVYKARHVNLNEDRVVKVIRIDPTLHTQFQDRFLREAEILVGLRHPNLAQTYDFGAIDDNTSFLALELVEGESVLQKVARNGKLTRLESLGIARQAALALQVAHDQGVVHGQISPNNLLLSKNEFDEVITKVVNFSFSKPSANGNDNKYLSPEQHDSSELVDIRSDIYSLGLTLYHMLAGRLPFDSSNLEGYLAKHINEELEPVSKHLGTGEIPKELDRLIVKALSKNKVDRQASMAELVREIDRVLLLDSSTTAVITTPPPRTEFSPGHMFAGRYFIEKRIGRGGMGTVYKAIDKILDIPVALKTLNEEIAGEERTLKRLKREVILARKVAHPNVCRIYDIGQTEGTPYVSMEFVAGRTLAEILQTEGKMKPDIGVPILKQILSALQEAHRAGVIHRDLKPQNIMVDADQHPYIMDFGISVSEDVHRLTETGILIGTPRYMAPEQFGSRNVDHRADIYSIGIIMFEMFTGRLPFEANTPAAVMYAHLYSPPPKPSEFSPYISPQLERIILKALEKDPQQRYLTDREIIADFEAMEESMGTVTTTHSAQPLPTTASAEPLEVRPEEPTAEKKSTIVERLPSSFLKNPIAWAIAGVVLVALVGGFLLFKPGDSASVTKSEPPTQSPQPKQVVTPPPAVVRPMVTPTLPAQPALRKIRLESQPPGASVSLDGKDTGMQTPADLSVSPDQSYEVELKLAGYETVKATIDQNTAENFPVSMTALSIPGKINYEGSYPVAIYNGKSLVLNTSTGKTAQLPAGSYNLTLLNMKGVLIRDVQKVEVKPGETTILKAPAMASLTITANPSNCTVVIDSDYTDSPPIFKLPVQAGSHQVNISWEKLQKQKSISVNIAPNEAKTLRAIVNGDNVDIFEETSK